MKEREQTQEPGAGLLQEATQKAAGLDDALFNRYLAFLDALIEHQAEQGRCQDSPA